MFMSASLFSSPSLSSPYTILVHEPGPPKGGHWYHRKVQIIAVIFDKVYCHGQPIVPSNPDGVKVIAER